MSFFEGNNLFNSQRWYLLGRTSRAFCNVDLHFVVIILHLSSFVNVFNFVVVSSFDFQAFLPCHRPSFSCPWRPPLALSSTPTTFDCLFFFIYRERYDFEWTFFTHRRFLPYDPSWHFGTTCFFQGFTGTQQILSWKLQGSILILEI